MTRNRKTFAGLISQTQLMTSGLKNNQAEVAKRGLESDFVTELEQLSAEAIQLNNEQEKLKSDLKLKTEAINSKIEKIQAKMSEAKKVVKLAIPQAGWKEFGIADKR